MAVAYTNFYGGAFFGGGFFGAGVDLTPEQASNWQATYWPNKSKADRENEEMLERIRLGILPPLEREAADEAAQAAQNAANLRAAERIDDAEHLRLAMEARAAYEHAYRTAYGAAYVEEIVAEQWRSDMKRMTRRKKAALLLLH